MIVQILEFLWEKLMFLELIIALAMAVWAGHEWHELRKEVRHEPRP